MRFRVLGCSGGSAPGAQLSCYLLDDVLAVDAGALTTALDFAAQRRVEDVLLTHGHLDHVWTLPLFLANRFGGPPVRCRLHASAYTLETVRKSLFNDRIWPDFTDAVRHDVPLVEFRPLEAGASTRIETSAGPFEVSAFRLSHAVPSQGYRIRSDGASLLICGDTKAGDALWELVEGTPDLAGIVIECSFPDRYDRIADVSAHLTPSLLGRELRHLRRDVPVYVTHVKPEDREEVLRELAALGDPRLRVLHDGQEFDV
jgi:cAMP phosphodiesterase